MAVDRARAEAAVRELLSACGLGVDDPRLARTPQRVASAAAELLFGEGVDPVPLLRAGRISIDGDGHPPTSPAEPVTTSSVSSVDSVSPVEPVSPGEPVETRDLSVRDAVPTQGTPEAAGNLVLLRNIRFRAMCEHHLLPFDGWVHLAYLPGDSIIGFGRLYELVNICSSRLTLQERLGEDLVDALMSGLDAQGALAVIEARQGCVADRGPRQADSDAVTLAGRGALQDPQARADALRLIALGGTNRDESLG